MTDAPRPADTPDRCSQCGRGWPASPCGPTHALIARNRHLAYLHDVRDALRRIDETRSIAPVNRRLISDIKDEFDPWDALSDVVEEWDATRRALDRAEATTQRLRDILAPLLDQPIDLQDGRECLFCGQRGYRLEYGDPHHEGCPVLERDTLLGLLDAGGAGPGRASTKEE